MRPKIPSDVARQLRKEAGFGCCKCGFPFIQYHHIVMWADDQHFRVEDMMVLCPNHHDQATKGAMPESEQRLLKRNPYNIVNNRVQGLLEVKQDYCAADFGSVTVVGEGVFLRIDSEDIIGFHMGPSNLEVSLKLFSQTDELLLEIDRNEWVSGDPLPWDIEAGWQTLVLREKARKISVNLNAKVVPMSVQGELWKSGKKFVVNGSGISLEGKGVFQFREIALVGMRLELDTSTLKFGPQPENAAACFVSWPNRRERLWRARDAWRGIIKSEA